MTDKSSWLSLITSLPTANATARMRVWRALKSAGCGVLRDGVYVLPDTDATQQYLQHMADDVSQSGGTAYVLKLEPTDVSQVSLLHSLFDRTDDYSALKHEIDALHNALSTQNTTASKRVLQRLKRDFTTLSNIDFFPTAARTQVATALTQVEAALNALSNPDEPLPAFGLVSKLSPLAYQQRVWATRKNIWVDRIASAWLIRRFIDPAATFLWLNQAQDCPDHAVGFDFDGASFSHVGSLVTFEVLLAALVSEPDPALERLACVIHYLDVGGIPVAEAHGLELILKGTRNRCDSDDLLLIEASKILDDLYMTYTNEESTHE
jgi:hypothetical protein